MTTEDFFYDYIAGRKDFRGCCLQGIDFFSSVIKKSHPELFSNDISKLVLTNSPVINKPLNGLIIENFKFHDASLLNSDLARSRISISDFSQVDARLSNFTGAYLSGIDFSDSDLSYSNLFGITLDNIRFHKTKLDHSIIKWASISNCIFYKVSGIATTITHSNFIKTKISYSNFKRSIFNYTHFSSSTFENSTFRGAEMKSTKVKKIASKECDYSKVNAVYFLAKNSNFTKSNFNNVNFSSAKFYDCDLSNAYFTGAQFRYADLNRVKLDNSIFIETTFYETFMNEVSFNKATFGSTKLINMNLSIFLISDLRHNYPSSIDFNSIARTISSLSVHPWDINPCPKLHYFLESCGMPTIVVTYLIDSIRSLMLNQLEDLMLSTFISYGTPDEPFAYKLNEDLRKNGVTTFFFPLDAPFGEKLHNTMRRVNNYDRIILICSQRSLDRPGLQYELEKTIEREAKDGGKTYLIPLTLDDYLYNGWKPKIVHLRSEIINRVIADFRETENYNIQFQRLLNALKNDSITKQKLNYF